MPIPVKTRRNPRIPHRAKPALVLLSVCLLATQAAAEISIAFVSRTGGAEAIGADPDTPYSRDDAFSVTVAIGDHTDAAAAISPDGTGGTTIGGASMDPSILPQASSTSGSDVSLIFMPSPQ